MQIEVSASDIKSEKKADDRGRVTLGSELADRTVTVAVLEVKDVDTDGDHAPIADQPRNIIDTVLVDPDDLIAALRWNGRPPEYKNQVSAVIRITPPFETESGTSIFYTEEGNYPSEMNPKPIHISPRVFVDENVVDQPIRSDERTRAKDELDEPTEEEIEEFVDMSFEVWESEVRNKLKTETDINDSDRQHGGPHMVEVLTSS